MTTKKNVGTRPRPKQRTPEEQRRHRAEQAARAILAGRNRQHNWLRIERHLRADYTGKVGYFEALEIPEAIQESVWPTPEVAVEPEPTPEPTPEPEPAAA